MPRCSTHSHPLGKGPQMIEMTRKYNVGVSRGSYNVSFEAGDSVASGLRTLSCDGKFGSESKC